MMLLPCSDCSQLDGHAEDCSARVDAARRSADGAATGVHALFGGVVERHLWTVQARALGLDEAAAAEFAKKSTARQREAALALLRIELEPGRALELALDPATAAAATAATSRLAPRALAGRHRGT